MSYLKLTGGKIYDPASNVDGEVQDIWIRDGKICPPPTQEDTASIRTIDLTGRIVFPGGIDMHCHIAGPKVNTARKMRPEHGRVTNGPSNKIGSVPDIFTAGMRYTGLGYTTCFDAAITPLASRHVHHELSQVPNVDKGFYVLVGNNHYAMERIAKNDQAGLESFLSWLLARTGAYAPKLVNPGGVEMWKQRASGNARDLDGIIDGFDVTPRQIVHGITAAANSLNLPHPVHIHCNNLGIPGNAATTLETFRAVDGLKAHFAHIQFHSYGGGGDKAAGMRSEVQSLAGYINDNPNLTVDVGQVMFGETTSMTGDGPLGYFLHSIGGERWFSADTEMESGCGISPINYRDKNLVHAMQWAIGLEWYLMVKDPWKVVMSTDHPNGGSFLAYPQIIRLLMDSNYRTEFLKQVNPMARKRTQLSKLSREYTLLDIATITSAGPARILGLENKGRLSVSSDADISVYTPDKNYESMFSWPYMVIKAGNIIVENGEFRKQVIGQSHFALTNPELRRNGKIESWFNKHYSISERSFGTPAIG